MDSKLLKIGVPSKGRLSELASDLLAQAGVKYRRQNRGLTAKVDGLPIEIVFLRTDDIPTMCAVGAIAMGITGSDLVRESELMYPDHEKVKVLKKLGVGKCRLAICVPEESDLESAEQLDGSSIATSFTEITKDYLAQHNAKAKVIALAGSVEIMIGLKQADAIVDLVETGSTLAANRLRIMSVIDTYETVLIQGPNVPDPQTAERVYRRLEGVLIARDYSLLEYNIPKAQREAAEAITPGMNSPTVNTLEDEDWLSIRAMVRRKEVITVMEQLEGLGASAILETAITNCRMGN
ncbi:MAG: ATP phosphoribosyltransferase [Planctomycetota bacterium]